MAKYRLHCAACGRHVYSVARPRGVCPVPGGTIRNAFGSAGLGTVYVKLEAIGHAQPCLAAPPGPGEQAGRTSNCSTARTSACCRTRTFEGLGWMVRNGSEAVVRRANGELQFPTLRGPLVGPLIAVSVGPRDEAKIEDVAFCPMAAFCSSTAHFSRTIGRRQRAIGRSTSTLGLVNPTRACRS
jgi:hypothetical protein